MSPLDAFLATRRLPLHAGAARRALTTDCRYHDRLYALHELVEELVGAGWRVTEKVVPDEARAKRLTVEVARLRRSVPWGNTKHPETIAFRKLETELAAGPTRTERRLTAPDGTFLRGLGLTAMDYAEHLTPQGNGPA